MSLHDEIKALPEWPPDLAQDPVDLTISDERWNDYLHERIGCCLARLALAQRVGPPLVDDLYVAALNADWDTFDTAIRELRILFVALEPPK